MPDREKVIRAVDSCFDYWLDQHRYIHPLELEHVRQIKADALALLKEQEAVEPYEAEMMITHDDGTKEYIKDIESVMLLAHMDYQIEYTGEF